MIRLTLPRCLVSAVALILVSGCHGDANIRGDTVDARMHSGPGDTLVVGRVAWIRNGGAVEIGDSDSGDCLTIGLHDTADDRAFSASVGRGGYFMWHLPPGEYHLSSLAFRYRASTFLGRAGFHVSVPATADPVYIGTLAVDTTMQPGLLGWKAEIHRFAVTEECVSDCEFILSQLGRSQDPVQIALMQIDEVLFTSRLWEE